MMNWRVSIYEEDTETVFRTSNFDKALAEMLQATEDGKHCDLMDCSTGEILAIQNSPSVDDCMSSWIIIKTAEYYTRQILK